MKPDDIRDDSGDDTRDAHLRKALQHAPDADLGAPRDISAQILAAAHRSVAERAPPPPNRRRWWQPLHPARWGASGALVTVVLAGLLGLLWRDEAPGPAVDSLPPAVQPTVAWAPASPPPPTTAAAPAQARTRPLVPAPAATAATAATAAAATAAAATTAEPLRAAAAAEREAPATDAVSLQGAAAPAAAQEQRSLTAAAPAATPWATTLLDSDELRWVGREPPQQQQQQQHSQQPRQPDKAWLLRLAELAKGRWHNAPDPLPASDAWQLQWRRGSATLGSFWLDRDSVRWCGAKPPCQQAPLPAAALRALLDSPAR